jgi:hypothetical protein
MLPYRLAKNEFLKNQEYPSQIEKAFTCGWQAAITSTYPNDFMERSLFSHALVLLKAWSSDETRANAEINLFTETKYFLDNVK